MTFPWTKKTEAPAPTAVDVQEVARIAAESAATEVARAMQPYLAMPEKGKKELYVRDNPWAFTQPQSPKRKPMSMVDVNTLRNCGNTYDIARSCILHLIAECAAIDLEVVPRDPKDTSPATKADIAKANAFLNRMDSGFGGFGNRREHFEAMVLEDVMVVGAAAIYLEWGLGGDLLQVYPIDAATIRPVVDTYGHDMEQPYEQWVMDVPQRKFAAHELIYDGIHPVSYSPYFQSRIEMLLAPIMAALKSDEWNRNWLIHGNTPSDILALPENWTPDQFRDFVNHWKDTYTGDSAARQQMKFVPSGTQRVGNPSRKDQDFQEFDSWLMKRCCSIFGVQPASIGYGDMQYKTSQRNSTDQTSMYGAGVLLKWRKAIYDHILSLLGFDHLQVENIAPWEEDQGQMADRLYKAVGCPWITINEARIQAGLDPVPGGDALFNPMESADDDAEPDQRDVPSVNEDETEEVSATRVALGQWMRKAIKRTKDGKPALCSFESADIPGDLQTQILAALKSSTNAADVRRAFTGAI